MATPIVRPVPVYVDGDKVAECTEGSFDYDPAITQLVTDAGVAFALGTPTCKMELNTIVPVRGQRVRLMEAAISQKSMSVDFDIDGKTIKFTGVLNMAGYNWSHQSGECKGKFGFIGSDPQLV